MESTDAHDVEAMQAEFQALRQQRWTTGKEAVDAIKAYASDRGKSAVVPKKGGSFRRLACLNGSSCLWFVNLSITRRKGHQNYWHVTTANLNHINCAGMARPTVRQLAASTVLHSAVVTDTTVSAPTLERQLQLQANIMCSRSMVYRVKQRALQDVLSEDLQTIEYLPSYLAEFALLNLGTFTCLERGSDGHFTRAIVALDPAWFHCGLRLFGVDSAHMKHRKYNGVQIVLVARDGNLQNIVAAIALASLEDHSNYLWFFQCLLSHGFPLRELPVFCDRHAGIISASTELRVFTMFCTRHLIGNMRADKKVKLAVGHEGMVWCAQAAETPAQYTAAIDNLSAASPHGGAYRRVIPRVEWALHPHYRHLRLYGWRTTNFVKSEQAKSLRLRPRLMLPYEYFRAYTQIMMGEAYLRLSQCTTWLDAGRVATPRTESKFQSELKQSTFYNISFSSDTVAYTTRLDHQDKPRRVDTALPACTCAVWLQQGIPCRHLLAVLKRTGGLAGALRFVVDCYTVSQYAQHQRAIELPDDSKLTPDKPLLPALVQRQAGRPRKRRFRSRREHGERTRVRGVYKCGKCGVADGHNIATCWALM